MIPSFVCWAREAPAYPLLNKNYAGDLLASAILIALFCPRELLRLGRLRVPLVLVLGLGLLASQSRGAMLGLGCGVALYAIVRRRFDGVSVLLLVAMFGGLALFTALLGGQSAVEQNQHYGALFERQTFVGQALAIWRTSPFIGTGIRFWQSGMYPLHSDPHNVLALTLAESGLVGLLSFVALLFCLQGIDLFFLFANSGNRILLYLPAGFAGVGLLA